VSSSFGCLALRRPPYDVTVTATVGQPSDPGVTSPSGKCLPVQGHTSGMASRHGHPRSSPSHTVQYGCRCSWVWGTGHAGGRLPCCRLPRPTSDGHHTCAHQLPPLQCAQPVTADSSTCHTFTSCAWPLFRCLAVPACPVRLRLRGCRLLYLRHWFIPSLDVHGIWIVLHGTHN
jgi:hypothetical protein